MNMKPASVDHHIANLVHALTEEDNPKLQQKESRLEREDDLHSPRPHKNAGLEAGQVSRRLAESFQEKRDHESRAEGWGWGSACGETASRERRNPGTPSDQQP